MVNALSNPAINIKIAMTAITVKMDMQDKNATCILNGRQKEINFNLDKIKSDAIIIVDAIRT